MIRQLAIIITLTLVSKHSSFGQNSVGKKHPDKAIDNYKAVYTSTELNTKFEFAFKYPLTNTLSQIFNDWNKRIEPNTKEFIEQNDTIKAVFDAYKEFYKPLDLLNLGNWEWGNKLNSESKYVAVQNNIYFAVVPADSLDDVNWNTIKKHLINDFRPPVNIPTEKVLYLTTEYSKALNQFLGTASTKMGKPNIMNPSRSAGESEKRFKALRPFIPILHGHWGGYWHLETHPEVNTILFNKDLTIAKFDFRVGYQGGEAILIRTSNGWTIKESKETWIE